MQTQSWLAAVVFALIGFGGGYVAGTRGPGLGTVSTTPGAGAMGNNSVYFSPQGGCTDAVVAEINTAAHDVEMQGYSFTSRPIGSALVAARRRGVHVTLVLDATATSEHRAEAEYVIRGGVPVYLDARHAIAHNKVILIDGRTIITGSFNFPHAAEEENAENLVILRDQPKLEAAYEDNFRHHLEHSERFDGK